jgi:hypothetical protein
MDWSKPMRSVASIISVAAILLVTTSVTRAQEGSVSAAESFLQQQRLINDKLRDERRELAPIGALLDWQWGGWLEYYVFHFDDGLQSSRLFQRPGLSAWSRLRIDEGAHEVFARVRLTFNYFKSGDEYDRQHDWEGANFDRAWYQIDVGRAFRLTKPSDPYQLRARIGRQEVVFGTGYVLDLPLDAVVLDARVHDLRAIGLFAKTIASYPNIDRSAVVADHSGRHFYGVQLSYEGFDRHVPFVYALWNQDHTDERPKDALQEYNYETQYFGIGSRGELAHNLSYWVEGAFETGRSYGDGNFLRRDTVEAWGWDVGVEKLFDVPMRPRVAFEYMFASGDSERVFSPTNAAGGNRGDRRDTSFVGFGYRDTGIAAGPALSNIHLWRLGGSFAPLAGHELFRDLELGTNWFLYHKNRSRAAIGDPGADMFEGYVGWEMDYFINWRSASDLSWTVRWGTFFPGSAYSDRDMRHFIFSGVTWSF